MSSEMIQTTQHNDTNDTTQKMHVVTVQFAIVLDEGDELQHELKVLCAGIQSAYETELPQGSWRIVSVGPAREELDLDACATLDDIVRRGGEITPLYAQPDLAVFREALEVADDAINEIFRYFDGGETRGSYDGKPEREQLRRAGYKVRAALSCTRSGR